MKMSYIRIAKLSSIERRRQYERKGHYHDKAEGTKAVASNLQGIRRER